MWVALSVMRVRCNKKQRDCFAAAGDAQILLYFYNRKAMDCLETEVVRHYKYRSQVIGSARFSSPLRDREVYSQIC